MMNFFEKADADLQKDVENELLFDPSVTNSDIGVSVKDGIVTMRGTVPHYAEKMSAEKAVERVGGVKAVADELEVAIKSMFESTDKEIAEAAVNAFQWSYSVPKEVKATVERGRITLTGEVDWDYQRTAAKEAVSQLKGVRAVINKITIKSKVRPSDIHTRIVDALKRSAVAEGNKVKVIVHGDTVTLSGKLHSIGEREDARFAAFMAPGVMNVENNITVSH
jgi:osmotically-inducible protein OsmY